MYIRPVHAELDVPTLQAFIQQYPLGLLTTSIAHPDHAKLQTTHIPFVIDIPDVPEGVEPEAAQASSSLGVLRGHIARANPQYKAMAASLRTAPAPSASESSASGSLVSRLFGLSSNESSRAESTSPSSERTISDPLELEDEVLVLFNLPTHSYVTPKFYTFTKPATGKVVPTWDYAAVQVYGRLRLHYENTPETSAFLQQQVEDLTDQRERAVNGEKAWRVNESPVEYVEALKKSIAGLEIQITRIEGRFKLSQESPDGDWEGVVQGFRAMGTDEGRVLADLIEARGQHRLVGQKGDPVVA